jgi:hypothetical protein
MWGSTAWVLLRLRVIVYYRSVTIFVACFLCTPVSYTSGDDLEQSANSLLIGEFDILPYLNRTLPAAAGNDVFPTTKQLLRIWTTHESCFNCCCGCGHNWHCVDKTILTIPLAVLFFLRWWIFSNLLIWHRWVRSRLEDDPTSKCTMLSARVTRGHFIPDGDGHDKIECLSRSSWYHNKWQPNCYHFTKLELRDLVIVISQSESHLVLVAVVNVTMMHMHAHNIDTVEVSDVLN